MTIHRTFFGRAVLVVAGAGLCVFAALAAAQAGDAKQGAEQLAENTKVSIRFSWKLKGEYAPFYVALDKGYFSAEGLDVKLGPGAGAQGALAAVEQGQETATYAPAIFGLQAISKGLDVKVIALYHPGTPMAFISHPENPVRSPKDLEGKTLAHSVGDTASSFLPVFCKANNIDCGKIKLVQLNYKAVMSQFLANKGRRDGGLSDQRHSGAEIEGRQAGDPRSDQARPQRTGRQPDRRQQVDWLRS